MSSIPTSLAKQLVKNYVTNNIGKVISETETRGVWFSKEELLEALNDKVHGISPNGLRFYFGAYETFEPGSRPPKHEQDQNKITLVIIPTTHRMDEDGNIIMHPYRAGESLPFDLLTDPKAAPSYHLYDFKEANDGQICPPPKTII